MIKTLKLSLLAVASSLMVACGGGGDETNLDKYTGRWIFTLKSQTVHVICPVVVTKLNDVTAAYNAEKCERVGPQVDFAFPLVGTIDTEGNVSGNMMTGTLTTSSGSGRWSLSLVASGDWTAVR